MTNEKVMRLALDALEYNEANWQGKNKALEALYAALVQPEREWQGLTEADMDELIPRFARYELIRAAEAKLKEKNA